MRLCLVAYIKEAVVVISLPCLPQLLVGSQRGTSPDHSSSSLIVSVLGDTHGSAMLPFFSLLPFLGGALISTVSAATERAPKGNATIPGAYMVEFEGSPVRDKLCFY